MKEVQPTCKFQWKEEWKASVWKGDKSGRRLHGFNEKKSERDLREFRYGFISILGFNEKKSESDEVIGDEYFFVVLMFQWKEEWKAIFASAAILIARYIGFNEKKSERKRIRLFWAIRK